MTTDSIQTIRENLSSCNDAIFLMTSYSDDCYALIHQRDRLERKLHDALVASGKITRLDRDVPTMRDFQD